MVHITKLAGGHVYLPGIEIAFASVSKLGPLDKLWSRIYSKTLQKSYYLVALEIPIQLKL